MELENHTPYPALLYRFMLDKERLVPPCSPGLPTTCAGRS